MRYFGGDPSIYLPVCLSLWLTGSLSVCLTGWMTVSGIRMDGRWCRCVAVWLFGCLSVMLCVCMAVCIIIIMVIIMIAMIIVMINKVKARQVTANSEVHPCYLRSISVVHSSSELYM